MLKSQMKLLLSRVTRKISPGRLVLMYHRISDGNIDPWKIAVSASNFAAHLKVLKNDANPVTLEDILFHRNLPHRSVAVTFDDGYADNLYVAKPLLKEYSIPAGFYISTGQIDSLFEFWWDELESIILSPGKLPETLKLVRDNKIFEWVLGSAAEYTSEQYLEDFQKKVWLSVKGTRLNLYYSIWQVLFPLESVKRRKLLDNIAEWSGKRPQVRETHRSLNSKELIQLADEHQFTIGAHGVQHVNLTTQGFSTQLNEIRESKKYLQDLLDQEVTSFAYPHGEYNQVLTDILQKENFRYALTTDHGSVRTAAIKYSVPRIQVEDLDENSFSRCLDKWFTE